MSLKMIRSFLNFEESTTNKIQLGIIFFFSICSLLPLFLGATSYIEETPLRLALKSSIYRDSAIMMISLSIPLLMDTIADVINSYFHKGRNIKKSGLPLKESFVVLKDNERILYMSGLLILPITALSPSNTINSALIYLCCSASQFMVVTGIVLTSLNRYNKKFWFTPTTYLSLCLIGFCTVSQPFLDNLEKNEPVTKIIAFLRILFLINSFLVGLIFFFCTTRWFFVIIILPIYRRQFDIEDKGEERKNIYFPLLFILACLSAFSCIVFVYFGYDYLYDRDSIGIVIYNLPFILSLLFVSFVTLRMVKFEVVEGLYALIEAKKVYVRYISHELRTPLNAVFVGLKLLTDDLYLLQQSSSNPVDADRYDTVCDVNSANRTALDILNDLLCFDKLESGILEVHKHEVSVLPFIFDCVGMFSSQAREGGVNFVIETDCTKDSEVPTVSTNSNCSPLTEDDTVFMDRFKMDQVLRNLVSNALKFTPRGGTIKINATFVPNIDKVEDVSVKPKKWVDFSSLLCLYLPNFRKSAHSLTSRVHMTDNFQDLEAGAYQAGSVDSEHDCKKKINNNEGDINPTPTNNVMDDNGRNGAISGKLVIVVTDSGVGLSDIDQKRLFKEVVQFKPELLQAGGGSGLGLWITNNIVKMHDGNISVYSAGDGLGCSFTVEISMERKAPSSSQDSFNSPVSLLATPIISPLILPKPSFGTQLENSIIKSRKQSMVICTDESSNCSEQSSLVPIASNPDQMNVLIVDDSNLNRKLLCKLFRTLGHVVEEAEDGLLAIEKVKAKMSSSEANKACYDIILMDFVMPNMDGPTSTKIIRALGYSAPIFGLTGNALDSDVEYFLKNGADRVMAKPFNMLLFKQNLSQIKCNDAIPGSGKSTSMLDVKEKCEIQSIQSRRSFFL